jgi:cell division protein FtsQ
LCVGVFHLRILYPSDGQNGAVGWAQNGKLKLHAMSIKDNIRKILFVTLWCVAGAGMMVLLVAAIKKRGSKTCKGLRVEIKSASQHFFIDKNDVVKMLSDSSACKPDGKSVSSFNLMGMKEKLKKNAWVKEAEVFFDNNDVLRISITEREPDARIFTVGGNSFYIDSSGAQLPLSDKLSVRLPVFTGFPSEKVKLTGADEKLMKQIKKIDSYILKDSFWSAQIAQIDITSNRTFELIPVVGNHIIEFGDGNDCEKKFHRLFIFYKEVLSKTGFDKYARVDVQYDGEVIGTKKAGMMKKSDSLQAAKNVALLIRSAQQLQADTVKQKNMKPLENNNVDKNFRSGDVEDSVTRLSRKN